MSNDGGLSQRLLETLDTIKSIDQGASQVAKEISDGDEESGLGFSAELPTIEIIKQETRAEDEENSDLLEDYRRARDFTYALQDATLVMLKNAATMAVATAHPRAYGVVNEIVTNMRGLNKDLMDIQKSLNESRTKHRTVPNVEQKEPEGGDVGVGVQTNPDGSTSIGIRVGSRASTMNILEVLKKARESGLDLSTLNNEDIASAAERLEAVEGEFFEKGEIDGSPTEADGELSS